MSTERLESAVRATFDRHAEALQVDAPSSVEVFGSASQHRSRLHLVALLLPLVGAGLLAHAWTSSEDTTVADVGASEITVPAAALDVRLGHLPAGYQVVSLETSAPEVGLSAQLFEVNTDDTSSLMLLTFAAIDDATDELSAEPMADQLLMVRGHQAASGPSKEPDQLDVVWSESDFIITASSSGLTAEQMAEALDQLSPKTTHASYGFFSNEPSITLLASTEPPSENALLHTFLMTDGKHRIWAQLTVGVTQPVHFANLLRHEQLEETTPRPPVDLRSDLMTTSRTEAAVWLSFVSPSESWQLSLTADDTTLSDAQLASVVKGLTFTPDRQSPALPEQIEQAVATLPVVDEVELTIGSAVIYDAGTDQILCAGTAKTRPCRRVTTNHATTFATSSQVVALMLFDGTAPELTVHDAQENELEYPSQIHQVADRQFLHEIVGPPSARSLCFTENPGLVSCESFTR